MNQNEFIEIVNPFKDKVFRLAKRLLVSVEEAEDATQDVLMKLWNKNESLLAYKSLEAFAMTITKNYCLDILKSKRAQNLQIVHTNYDSNEQNSHQKLEVKDSLKLVEKAISTLSENQKLVIQLRDIEGFEFDEIAKMLSMNETTIRVNLSRARKEIREYIIKNEAYGI